jgi:hypothetical protein
MDDDSRLTTQMAMIKAVNPKIKVLGYRNSIQAYNWMSVVREKLDDPLYAGWFLQYRDGIDGATHNSSKYGENPCAGPAGDNTTKCTKFWHFGLTSFSNPCPGGECDCGAAPCAAYEFDHRNASFSEWFVSEYVMGKLGMGDKNQDGMYFDDGWVGGQPQEVSPTVITGKKRALCFIWLFPADKLNLSVSFCADAGMTPGDVHDIQCAWQQTFAKAQQAIIDAGGWNWQLFKQVRKTPLSFSVLLMKWQDRPRTADVYLEKARLNNKMTVLHRRRTRSQTKRRAQPAILSTGRAARPTVRCRQPTCCIFFRALAAGNGFHRPVPSSTSLPSSSSVVPTPGSATRGRSAGGGTGTRVIISSAQMNSTMMSGHRLGCATRPIRVRLCGRGSGAKPLRRWIARR